MASSQLQHADALPQGPHLNQNPSLCPEFNISHTPPSDQEKSSPPPSLRHELVHNVVENSPNLIVRFGPALEHLYVNQAYAALTTYSPQQLQHHSFDNLPFPSHCIESLKNAISIATRTKLPYSTELLLHHHNRAAQFFMVHIQPELDSSNRVSTTLLNGCDITQLKHALLRQQLRTEHLEARLPHEGLDATSSGVAIITMQGDIIHINQHLLDTLGCPQQKLSPNHALLNPARAVLSSIIEKTLQHFRTTTTHLSFHDEISPIANQTLRVVVQGSLVQSHENTFPIIALTITKQSPVRTIEQELQQIEWQLAAQSPPRLSPATYHLDIPASNQFVNLIGQQTLNDILSEFVDLLGTCSTIHDCTGTYRIGLFAPGWCSFLQQSTAPPKQHAHHPPTHCHRGCQLSPKTLDALNQRTACSRRCRGGLHIFAVPIVAGGELVGSISFGFGSPPLDKRRLLRLADRFGSDVALLHQQAQTTIPIPTFVQEHARKRLWVAARMLGSLLERQRAQQSLLEQQQCSELLIEQRSRQLLAANQRLQSEIKQHITTQQMLNVRQEALETIYAIATAFSSTLQEMCDQLISYLAQSLQLPFASIVIIVEDKIQLVSQFCSGTIQASPTIDIATHPIRFCLQTRTMSHPRATDAVETFLTGDIEQATPQNSAYIGIPLATPRGTLIGGVCVIDTPERVFDNHQTLLLEIFSRYIAHEASRTILEEQLRQAEEMRTLGQLTSGVAHEVRNPLNAIQAISEALFMELGQNEACKPFMHHINNQVTRLSKLMQNLLELGRNDQQPDLERIELFELLSEIIETWKSSSAEEARVVELLLPHTPSLAVEVDCARFQQVIFNLLENAAHFTPPSLPLTIRVSPETAHRVKIEIIDRGKGVEPELEERLFKPFFTTRKGGTGLGLCIVRHIVEMHGGEASLKNNPDSPGAVATITLPLLSE